MRDEVQGREPQQRIMPFIATPTQTADTYETNNDTPEPPAITAAAREVVTPPFILGPDTCGFTSSSTITCDVGYDCENVGNYRGCCVAGGEDCSATIYTACLNYEDMPNAAMCGPQTLCCPLSKAYCATYGFTTEEQPGATFTHVQCAETPGFGELYPYPPELVTTIEASSTPNTSSTLAAQPARNTSSSSSHSISRGAIAGAVVGSIVFAALAILGICLFAKRKRRHQWEQRIHNGSGVTSAPYSSTEDVQFGGGGASAARLRPLSTIHEREIPSPNSTSSKHRQHSAPNTLRPQSVAQNWPLGGPVSPRKPLSSHPVGDPERRPSRDEFPPRLQSSHSMEADAPILRTRLSPPPPLKKPDPARMSSGGDSTSAVGLALQSPRLPYIPTPTIDTAFGEDVQRRLDGVGEPDNHTLNRNETSSSALPLLATAVPWPAPPGTGVGTKNKRLTNRGLYINPNLEIPRPHNDSEPVSPLDGTGSGGRDDMVSPLSPDDADGRFSPMTVSPLESPRDSVGL
ncbi:hypothetical protein ANO14919_102170 [Xylariales sp. No.14919]|nr:hypothetical protein ANO14919_102170 [Xylariales sp. No.14919]